MILSVIIALGFMEFLRQKLILLIPFLRQRENIFWN